MKNFPSEHLVYKFENYALDTEQKTLLYKNTPISLGQKPYECLLLLVKNSGRIVSKEEFFETIWKESFVEDAVLTVNISTLRKILGAESGINKKFIETIPRKGYKLAAEIVVERKEIFAENPERESISAQFQFDSAEKETDFLENKSSPATASSAFKGDSIKPKNLSAQQHFPGYRKPHISKFNLIFIGLCFGGFLFLAFQQLSSDKDTTKLQKVAVVIFPFENLSENSGIDDLSVSLADSLSESLHPVKNASVVPISSTRRFSLQSYDPLKEGKDLGARYVVTGSYQVENDDILVNLQLTDISTASPIGHQQRFQAPVNNLSVLQATIFQFLVFQLNLNRNDKELNEIQQMSLKNPNAYENFVRGKNAMASDERDLAITYLQEALKTAPDFVPILDNLAVNYANKASFDGCGKSCSDKAIEVLEKIISLNPDSKRAGLRLAAIYVHANKMERAMALIANEERKSPENKFVKSLYGMVYRFSGALEESVEITESARLTEDQNAPESQSVMAYFYLGKYELFINSMRFSAESRFGNFYRGLAHYCLKNFPEAERSFEKSLEVKSDTILSRLGKVYYFHLQKEDAEARRILNAINKEVLSQQPTNAEFIYAIAQANAVLGQKTEALKLFDLSVENGFFCYSYFVQDPLTGNLVSEPEFSGILEKARQREENFKGQYLKRSKSEFID